MKHYSNYLPISLVVPLRRKQAWEKGPATKMTRYADSVDMDEEVSGPAGTLGEVSLPSTEDDDASFDVEMSKAPESHAWDDYEISSEERISDAEVDALNEEGYAEVPSALQAGEHRKSPERTPPPPPKRPAPRRLPGMPVIRERTLTPPSPDDSDSASEDHVDPDFDPASIHPVDMENPEVIIEARFKYA